MGASISFLMLADMGPLLPMAHSDSLLKEDVSCVLFTEQSGNAINPPKPKIAEDRRVSDYGRTKTKKDDDAYYCYC